jgi:hypothetical protein
MNPVPANWPPLARTLKPLVQPPKVPLSRWMSSRRPPRIAP